MTTPDVIVSWPDNCDYPIWRKFIRDNRFRFGKVIVVFTKTNQAINFTEFVRQAMEHDDITFIESPKVYSGQDWRNVAVNAALQVSESDWVWFTEQDLVITTPYYWDQFTNKSADFYSYYVGDRMHPCNIYMTRYLIDETSRDFSANPPDYDHFGKIQEEVESLYENNDIDGEFIYENEQFYHLNGLSHNFSLLARGEKPNYKIEEFTKHMQSCIGCGIELDNRWIQIVSELV